MNGMDRTDLRRSQPNDAAILVFLGEGEGPGPRIAYLLVGRRDPEVRMPEPRGRGRHVQRLRTDVIDLCQENTRIGIRHTIELLLRWNDKDRVVANGGLKQPARDAPAGERDEGSFDRLDGHGNLPQLIAVWRLVNP